MVCVESLACEIKNICVEKTEYYLLSSAGLRIISSQFYFFGKKILQLTRSNHTVSSAQFLRTVCEPPDQEELMLEGHLDDFSLTILSAYTL